MIKSGTHNICSNHRKPQYFCLPGELIKNVEQKQGTKIKKKKKGSTLRELHFDFIQYVKSRF